MRARSERIGGYQVFGVAGTNTVSFAIDAGPGVTKGLLGFARGRRTGKLLLHGAAKPL
jgi:hypothetical protein